MDKCEYEEKDQRSDQAVPSDAAGFFVKTTSSISS